MIAADTSAVLHFLHGFNSPARALIRNALSDDDLFLPAVVVTELLSGIDQEPELITLLSGATRIPIKRGYWERVGATRRLLKTRGLRCRLADSLVAQSCIDADVALIAGDSDFQNFADHCGLKLAT